MLASLLAALPHSLWLEASLAPTFVSHCSADVGAGASPDGERAGGRWAAGNGIQDQVTNGGAIAHYACGCNIIEPCTSQLLAASVAVRLYFCDFCDYASSIRIVTAVPKTLLQ